MCLSGPVQFLAQLLEVLSHVNHLNVPARQLTLCLNKLDAHIDKAAAAVQDTTRLESTGWMNGWMDE